MDQELQTLFHECEEHSSTLVVATKRLARELRHQFNNMQANKGIMVWQSPDILTFDAWAHRLWQESRNNEYLREKSALSARPIMVLSKLQSRAIWQEIIGKDISSSHSDVEPLWNIPATVSAALNAWKLCNEWQIDREKIASSFSQDHKSFARWSLSYNQVCKNNGWLDAYVLIDHLIAQITNDRICELPPTIVYGFDILTTQQERLINTLVEKRFNARVFVPTAVKVSPSPQNIIFPDQYQQWLGAAQWAKNHIESKPDSRVAIVVPDISQCREPLEYAMHQTLNPNQLITKQNKPTSFFHLSLGKPLAEYGVTRAALTLLELARNNRHSNQSIADLILSPFILGAKNERFARSKLEYWCRSNLPYEITLQSIFNFLSTNDYAPSAPGLLSAIEQAVELKQSFKSKNTFQKWSELILQWLDRFGWPGEQSLNSEEYQIVEALKKEIIALTTLDTVNLSVTLNHVFSILFQRLQEQPFESESVETNVEILGILETAGLQFDAIWFGNLTNHDWPGKTNQSAFIPYKLQAHIARANYQLNNQLAQRQMLRLTAQCNELVHSRYAYTDDLEISPSLLFRDDLSEKKQAESLLQCSHQLSQFELYDDHQGTSYTQTQSQTRGGVSLINAQSSCPFKAYAKQRLGAFNEELRRPGLTPSERGSLIHTILEKVWIEIKTSDALNALADETLLDILKKHIASASKRYFTSSGLSPNFFTLQSHWLQNLLLQWFEAEKLRDQPFEILQIEKKIQLGLSQLKLDLKIDRIDKLADQTLMLIDYKTGRAESINSWVQPKTASLQLPLYALAQLSDVSANPIREVTALTVAQVRSGECAYIGLSKTDDLQTRKNHRLKFQTVESGRLSEEFENWEALLNYWQIELVNLAKEFESGYALVDPSRTACRYCDLHGLCRIVERELAGDDDV